MEENSAVNPRVTGLVVLLCGVALAYFGCYQPLSDIQQGVPEFRLGAKAAIGAPIAFGFGLVYLILGPIAERFSLRPWKSR